MKKQLFAIGFASLFLASTQASAITTAEYLTAKAKIEADSVADAAKCLTLKGNAQKVCEKEGSGKEDVAKAMLEQQYKPSANNQRKIAEEKVNAAYKVAKAKCDDLSSSAKESCEAKAKADRDAGEAAIK